MSNAAAAAAIARVTASLSGGDVKLLSRRKPKTDTLPARVLALLVHSPGPLSAPAIARALGVSWPTAAATLKAMAEAGRVVVGTTEGGQHRYALPLPRQATAAHGAMIRKALLTGSAGAGEPNLEAVLAALGQADD